MPHIFNTKRHKLRARFKFFATNNNGTTRICVTLKIAKKNIFAELDDVAAMMCSALTRVQVYVENEGKPFQVKLPVCLFIVGFS